jgi:hypothetical protein
MLEKVLRLLQEKQYGPKVLIQAIEQQIKESECIVLQEEAFEQYAIILQLLLRNCSDAGDSYAVS